MGLVTLEWTWMEMKFVLEFRESVLGFLERLGMVRNLILTQA